jgi:hypothetical protein
MRPGLLGPPFGDEAVAARASGSPLLGWAADRGGNETRIDVERHVDDGEAVGRRADLGEIPSLGSYIGEEKGAVSVELRAERRAAP